MTEKPSAKRLRKARLEGDSPSSALLIVAASLAAALVILPGMARAGLEMWSTQIFAAIHFHGDAQTLQQNLPLRLAQPVLLLCAPLLGLAFVAACVAGLLQSQGHVAWKRVSRDSSRFAPGAALAQTFSAERLWSVARGVLGVGLFGVATLFLLKQRAAELVGSVGSVQAALRVVGEVTYQLGWVAVCVATLLGAVDFMLARQAWLARNKMSRAELLMEARDAEADPHVRALRRRVQNEESSPAAA